MTCTQCGGPVVAALRPDAVEAGETPNARYCAPCWRLVFARELVAKGRVTDYPGFPHDAHVEQRGNAQGELTAIVRQRLGLDNPWADGREFGE